MMNGYRHARGATLFEFAVSACAWAVLVAVLLHYVVKYQASAEIAGARWQVEQMRSALLGKVLAANVRDPVVLKDLAGINPIGLLDRAPPAYRGEFDNAGFAEIPLGSWYFDRKQQILVYLFNGNKSFFEDTPERWMFRVEFTCLPTNNAKPPGTPPADCGVALHQVDG